MTTNILDPSALIAKLPALLPVEKTLSSPLDALAALIHVVFCTVGFRLVGIDDSSSNNPLPNNELPVGWNNADKGCITTRYRHEQSSFEFVVKVMRMGNRTVVNAVAVEVS